MSKLRIKCPRCGDSRILSVPDLKVSGRATCVIASCSHEFKYRGPEAPAFEKKSGKDVGKMFEDLFGKGSPGKGSGSIFDNMFNKRN